ncbi:unnamed protein product [Allacma fusca]|uniref:Uncharacterized protein n=1 Tax=Allacma fusca TaxID=39272 RepID=A0A8J2P9W7_9HEXA|nr:unnamed protein product [Allacma fusca]
MVLDEGTAVSEIKNHVGISDGQYDEDIVGLARDIRTSQFQDPDTKLGLLLQRNRRGLGNWLKKVFHIKTTSKTTIRPQIPPVRSTTPEPFYSSEEVRGSLFKSDLASLGIEAHLESTKVTYVADQHGDTEIDWLLPKSLRRSSIVGAQNSETKEGSKNSKIEVPLPIQTNVTPNTGQQQFTPSPPIHSSHAKGKPKHGTHHHKHHHSYESHRGKHHSEEPTLSKHHRKSPYKSYPRPSKYSESSSSESSSSESLSSEPSKEKRKVFQSFEPLGRAPSRALKRNKRSLLSTSKLMTLPNTPITKIMLEETPIETGSKEELRLLHELFINIVNGRCPKSLNSQFADDIELNLFRIIDSSNWEDTQKETSPEMTTLIHQLVNCSIASEAQKDLLEMFLYQETHFHSPSHDLELGAPVSRSKRGRLLERKKTPSQATRAQEQLTLLSNFEFSLITFISDECKHDISQPLLHSASQLILETIHKNFLPFIPISEEMSQENLNILQYCAGVIMKHREKEMRLKRKLQDNFKNFPPTIIGNLGLAGEAGGINGPSKYFKRGGVRPEKDLSGNEDDRQRLYVLMTVCVMVKSREPVYYDILPCITSSQVRRGITMAIEVLVPFHRGMRPERDLRTQKCSTVKDHNGISISCCQGLRTVLTLLVSMTLSEAAQGTQVGSWSPKSDEGTPCVDSDWLHNVKTNIVEVPSRFEKIRNCRRSEGFLMNLVGNKNYKYGHNIDYQVDSRLLAALQAKQRCPIQSTTSVPRIFCPTRKPNGPWISLAEFLLCDGIKNCPNGEDEDEEFCTYLKSTKRDIQKNFIQLALSTSSSP